MAGIDSLISGGAPIGAVIDVPAGATLAANWKLTDGALLARASFGALLGVIGDRPRVAATSQVSSTTLGTALRFGNGRYVALGQWSTDSVNYTAFTNFPAVTPSFGTWWDGTRFITAGNGDATNVPRLVHSTNGAAWTAVNITLNASDQLSGLFVANNRVFFAGATPSNSVWGSETGITTTQITTTDGSTLRDVAFGAGLYVLVFKSPATGSSVRTTTAANISLTDRTLPGGNQRAVNAIAFGNAKFVVVGDGGLIFTSSDGISWTQQTSPLGAANLTSVQFANGLFWIGDSSNNVAASADGATWTAANLPGFGTLAAAHYVTGIYLLLSTGGIIAASVALASRWTVTTGFAVPSSGASVNGQGAIQRSDGLLYAASGGTRLIAPPYDAASQFQLPFYTTADAAGNVKAIRAS